MSREHWPVETQFMNDAEIGRQPVAIRKIVSDSERMSFEMISEAKVGALLAALAASKPAGRVLELGTGKGYGTARVLGGADTEANMSIVDTEKNGLGVGGQ